MRDQGGGDVQCTAWRLLDAQFWGVPQRRKRIYLVNDFGNGRAGQILFECESMLGYHSQGGAEEQGNSGNSENSLTGTDCRGMAEDADGQMKLDFGRTADRIYINAKTSVTLMGNAGGGGGKTGLYLLPTYTIIGNIIGRSEKAGGNGKGIDDTGICPTLTTSDRHVVAYNASGYGEFKEGVGTLKKSRGAAGGGSEMTITVKIEDLPEFKARLARIKKIMRRRAWVNGHRTGKARKRTWKRVRHH